MKLKDKVIIVIGAPGGIGKVFCRVFRDQGAKLVLVSRTEQKLLALQQELGEKDTLVVPSDASSYLEVEELFKQAKEKFGHVDAVIISAGSWARLSISDDNREAENRLSEHYRGIFQPSFVVGFVAQRFFKKQGYGWIINISSHAAVRPELKGNLSYGAMKAAARHFMLALRNELVGSGVRVVDLQPAIVNTPDNQKALDTPEKRAGAVQPEDIATWIVDHMEEPDLPGETLFDSKIVLD